MRSVCVFCGSRSGDDPAYAEAARALGVAAATSGITVVTGGGHVGLMGVLADATLAAGGRVHGVIPARLEGKELAHRELTALDVTPSMHTRKARMHALSDGFMALPGGFGTLDELFETLTWAQLGMHHKPIGLVDVRGYWAPLVAWTERAVTDGFVSPGHAAMLMVDADPVRLLARLAAAAPGA